MVKDSIVEEVRKIRRKIYKECNNDLDTYFAMLKNVGEKYKKENNEKAASKHKKHARKKAA
jgi:hypothetical protein